MPEDSKSPIFQVDQTGKRHTTAADATRRELGNDPRTMAQNGVAPRVAAADQSLQEKLAQGAALRQQLQQKQAQSAAMQQRLDAAHQAVTAADQTTGPDSQTQRIRAREERIRAESALENHTQELQALQKQHDAHYSALAHEQRARHAEIGHYQRGAAASPHDAPWQKDSASLQGDPRVTNFRLIAAAEKQDPASAEAMRRALLPPPAQRLFAAAEKSFGSAQPAQGQSMTLHDMLMQAPGMTQGQGARQTSVDQAAAARATAQSSLGITDPENVRATRGADGSILLSRPGANGTHQPFATLDPRTSRITLATGADGQFTQAAAALAASAPAGPRVYFPGSQPPLSEAQVSDLIQTGLAATASTTDRKAADAALTQAGLSPEGIAQRVNEGRLSVQDGQLLNRKLNSGVSSYAARDKADTDRQHDDSDNKNKLSPESVAEQLRLREANEQFLHQQYPQVPLDELRRNYNAYRDDYVRRNYDLPDGVDDKTFHHLNGKKQEQQKLMESAAGAGVSSAMTSGQKLQAMSEWLKAHPNAGKDEQAAWHRTYDHVTTLLDPYRSLVHKALDGGAHEQDVLLDTLADLPEAHRELLMRYAATVAKQRGANHMLGVAGTVGASAERTLRDMFTSVSRIPPSLKTQVEEGQTSFKGPITSVDQALEALSADAQDPRHNYYKRVQQAPNLPLRPLSDEEKSFMMQALQREQKRNGLALTMRSILDEAEPLNDTVLGKMAAGLGSSLPLVLAATPQGMLAAGAGYANADFHEIMAEHPEMDEAAAAKVALVSGTVKAGLDKLSLFGLGKLAPNVAKVLSGQATSQMVKKAALQAGAAYGFENFQEGLQDLTRPAVQSLAASLGQDIQGVDWDREMKQFWGSRLDVALGVLPLTLLGIGHNTLQNRQSVLDILNNDQTLKLAGLAENDRASILKAAQAGDDAKAQALLQEAWNRRDPAIAAEAIKEADEAGTETIATQGTQAPALNNSQHVSGGRPGLPEGAKLLQSSEHWFIFEKGGKKWVRFYAPEARSPNTAKKGGRGDGHDNTAAHLTPEGRIYVSEGQHRLNGVVLENETNLSSVPGHSKWLEYEFKGDTDAIGEPPKYNPGEPHVNENRINPWDGLDGY